jgi:hypothetical protein
MTEDDFRRIEQNLAEEIRRKNCQMGAQQYDNDYIHFSDAENTPGGRRKTNQFKQKTIHIF